MLLLFPPAICFFYLLVCQAEEGVLSPSDYISVLNRHCVPISGMGPSQQSCPTTNCRPEPSMHSQPTTIGRGLSLFILSNCKGFHQCLKSNNVYFPSPSGLEVLFLRNIANNDPDGALSLSQSSAVLSLRPAQ